MRSYVVARSGFVKTVPTSRGVPSGSRRERGRRRDVVEEVTVRARLVEERLVDDEAVPRGVDRRRERLA